MHSPALVFVLRRAYMIGYNVKLHSQRTRLATPVLREGCASVQSDHVLVTRIAAHPWPLGRKSGGKRNPAVSCYSIGFASFPTMNPEQLLCQRSIHP
jgi:hypothetical protein